MELEKGGGFVCRVPDFEWLVGGWKNGSLGSDYRYQCTILFHESRIGTPGELGRYTLIQENSSGKGWAGVMQRSGLEISALPSLQQKWGILGTHDSNCTKGMWK